MADLDTIVKIAGVAAPLSKSLIDTFVTPKLASIALKWKRKDDLISHSFENKLQDYIVNSYKKYSVINTIVFNNQAKLLKDLYIPLEIIKEGDIQIRYTIDNYSNSFLPSYNKLLITDTAGMGKSTILKRLFISIVDDVKGIPVLIELRRLSDENRIIDELIKQLKAINEDLNKDFILDLINRGDFIFLFDGFDEIPMDRRQFVTNEIQSFVTKASKNTFVLTSRPEGALASFGDFEKFKVRPLKNEEAYELLKKYDKNGKFSSLLINKIKESIESIHEFLTNPLLVSLLYTAFEHKQTIPFKKHIFYRQVYDALFESHDLTKGDSFIRNKFSGLDIDDFHKVLRYMGYVCLTKDRIEFTKDEILALLEEAKSYIVGFTFSESNFLKDLVNTVPLFVIDGVYYKWAHKSLQEYFAAQFIYVDSKEKQKDILIKLYQHEDNQRFFNLFDLYYSVDYESFKKTIIYQLLLDYKAYLKESYSELLLPYRKDRQKFTFTHDFILINYEFGNSTGHENVRKLFDLIPTDLRKKKGWSLTIISGNKEQKTGFIKVPVRNKPTHTILDFLRHKNEPFVVNHYIESVSKKASLKLPAHVPFFVDDKKESILNTRDNFKETNDIIAKYVTRTFLTIDDEQLNNLITEIEKEIISKETSSFLLNF